MSCKAGRIVALGATLAAVGAMFVATTSASAAFTLHFTNYTVSGFLKPKLLNEPVTLPPGSTFNGSASLEVVEIGNFTGTITGDVFVPPFTASLRVLGLIPTEVGVTFKQIGKPAGTIATTARSNCSGPENVGPGSNICVALNVPTKAVLGITLKSVSVLEPPRDKCETAEPVTFPLKTTATLSELISKGLNFKGEATIPPIRCEGLEGIVMGLTLTAAMSGPDNEYELAIAPPK
jgi:hypothetical protein